MAGEEVFTPDVAAFSAMSEHLKVSSSETAKTMQNLSQMKDVLNELKDVAQDGIIPKEQADTANDLYIYLLKLGAPLESIKKIQNEINDLVKEEKKQRESMGDATEKAGESSGRIAKSFKKAEHTLKSAATTVTGVQLSLLGILALLLKIYNESNRISGQAMKIQAHWGTHNEGLKTAGGLLGELRKGFAMTYDAAGEYLTSVAKAGMEQKDMNKLASEMLGIQVAQGQEVGDQLNKLQGLVNSYSLASDEAQNHLVVLREEAKTLGDEGIMMSMGEYVDTWTELIDKTKAYNNDLLGTTALYNTLIKKAGDIGLGDMPVALRKELSKTVAGFSAELEDGWKAALGEGETIAGRILEFEGLKVPEQFERFAKFINEKASAYSGDTQKIVVRELLKNFGFTSKEMQKAMSEAFTEGAFNEKNLQNVMNTIQKQRLSEENLEKRATKLRQKLLTQGKDIAKLLKTLEEKIQQKIADALRPLVGKIAELISSISALTDKIPALPGLPDIPDTSKLPGASKYTDPITTKSGVGSWLGVATPSGRVAMGERQLMKKDAEEAANITKEYKKQYAKLHFFLQGTEEMKAYRSKLRSESFRNVSEFAPGMAIKDIKKFDPSIMEKIAKLIDEKTDASLGEAIMLMQISIDKALKGRKNIRSSYKSRAVKAVRPWI